MTGTAKPHPHRFFVWIVVTILLAAACGVLVIRSKRKAILRTPVAAYLLPVDSNSRVKLSWWSARKLTAPVTLHAAEPLSIPNGSAVKLVHASSGDSEIITGPAKIVLQQKLPNETNALVSPFDQVFKDHLNAPREDKNIIINTPVGVTRYLNPVIAWENGQPPFDVAVVDPSDPDIPPRVAQNVTGPVRLAELETPQRRQLAFDRNYEVLVRTSSESGRILGHARVLTLPEARLENDLPTEPADLMAEACAAMAKKPYRTGDAWLALSRLPADWSKSELGIRLRMLVSAQLYSPSQIEESKADAAKIVLGH